MWSLFCKPGLTWGSLKQSLRNSFSVGYRTNGIAKEGEAPVLLPSFPHLIPIPTFATSLLSNDRTFFCESIPTLVACLYPFTPLDSATTARTIRFETCEHFYMLTRLPTLMSRCRGYHLVHRFGVGWWKFLETWTQRGHYQRELIWINCEYIKYLFYTLRRLQHLPSKTQEECGT